MKAPLLFTAMSLLPLQCCHRLALLFPLVQQPFILPTNQKILVREVEVMAVALTEAFTTAEDHTVEVLIYRTAISITPKPHHL